MTTASDTSFTLTRDQLVTDALITLGAKFPGEGIDDQTLQYGARMLNMMVLGWQAFDLHLWLETEATLFLQQNQYSYSFTNQTSGDNCTNSYEETTVSTTITSGTSLVVASVIGMNVNDNIGIIMDSGLTFWTTISAINTGTKTITLASAITSQATAGNFVHVYTNKIYRPLRVLDDTVRRYQYSTSQPNETKMKLLARIDYLQQPAKNTPGIPVQCYYDPQLTTGKFYVWNAPQDSSNAVKFSYDRPLYDFLNASDTPDLPQEWLDPIMWNLAVAMGPFCGKTMKAATLKPIADEKLKLLLSFDREKASVRFGVSKY